MRFALPLALLAAALIAGPAASQTIDADAMHQALQRATGGMFRGAVAVAHRGEIVFARGYGLADLDDTPCAADTLFEIASVSKPFTAAAVLLLHKRGALDVHAGLGEYFEDVPDDKKDITVLQVLQHSSGLSPRLGLPYASRATREEFLAKVWGSELAAAPGAEFAYCNSGYALLAALVEVVSGQSFETFVRENLFEPAGMEDTGFIGDQHLDRERTAARLSGGQVDGSAVDWHWSWGYRGMGGVVSTVTDLMRWDRALAGDALFDAKTKEVMFTPGLGGYACGWQISRTDRDTAKVAHTGSVRGFRAVYSRFPDEELAIAVLAGESDKLFAIETAVLATVFPPPSFRANLDWTGLELGQYRNYERDWKTTWRAEARGNGTVELSIADPETDHVLARVAVPRTFAGKLAADLARMAADKAGGEGDDAACTMGIFLIGRDEAGPTLDLGDQLDIMLMPRYAGMGEDGKVVNDDRVTFVVVDTGTKSWPILCKMNKAAALGMANALRAVLE